MKIPRNFFISAHTKTEEEGTGAVRLDWVIDAQGLRKIYRMGGAEVRALDGVDLQVARGEFVAIVGRSGSGKSTLMNVLGCLDTPDAGSYALNGRAVAGLREKELAAVRSREIGFVFQSFCLIPTLDALENVELPLRYLGVPRRERRACAEEALERVGLAARLRHRPAQMSGGQQQRVAIARAIAARPPLLLADEPTGNLDSESGAAVMALLRSLHREGKTLLLITHDPAAASCAGRAVSLCDGRASPAPPRPVLSCPVQKKPGETGNLWRQAPGAPC